MDAKNIFIVCGRYIGRIKWEMIQGNEWSYIGIGDDYNESKVKELIERVFGSAEIYLVMDRHNSFLTDTKNATESISELLKKNEVTLSNKDFTKMMVFGKIGIVKHGERM
ncbi:hypothetical protein CLV51_106175 [Chitinophaga niastensis]|uniref:Uncharacterized protein n=1 Tax=Chitinophaga niastensis TaxID=536980 RepID=A0A2P8HDK3_CHINA|nr:hypothetical protein [Chitinophaga niastensis]PSL44309.1 hypothetical protein CLV51_106175 [Chitinophaga niastensis]